jgi:hypothetical protein
VCRAAQNVVGFCHLLSRAARDVTQNVGKHPGKTVFRPGMGRAYRTTSTTRQVPAMQTFFIQQFGTDCVLECEAETAVAAMCVLLTCSADAVGPALFNRDPEKARFCVFGIGYEAWPARKMQNNFDMMDDMCNIGRGI